MAHHQDRRAARSDLLFQPHPCRDIEVVVGLVEEQHVGTRGQEEIEDEALALAARQLASESGREIEHRRLDASLGGGKPFRLQFVAAEITPFGECFSEGHPVVGSVEHGPLGDRQSATGETKFLRRNLDEHVPQRVRGARHANVLRHREDVALHRRFSVVGFELTAQDAQDRALADPVRPDKGGVLARRNTEAHVEEQGVMAWRGIGQLGNDDAAHPSSLAEVDHCSNR